MGFDLLVKISHFEYVFGVDFEIFFVMVIYYLVLFIVIVGGRRGSL